MNVRTAYTHRPELDQHVRRMLDLRIRNIAQRHLAQSGESERFHGSEILICLEQDTCFSNR
jgi:hypothetical protein